MKESKNLQPIEKELENRENIAKIIRAKLEQRLTLTKREEIFLREQKEENLHDDNPTH